MRCMNCGWDNHSNTTVCLKCGQPLRMPVGSEDKSVTWSVKEENSGVIDRNGLYQAPELPGTYEITAVAGADESVSASAFVIVE